MNHLAKKITTSLAALLLCHVAACSSTRQYPSPPASTAAKLERAGANYQASEEAPTYRQSISDQPSASPR